MDLKTEVLEGLNNALLQNLDRGERDPFRMSSAGKCVRALYYQATKAKITNPMEPRLDLIFRCGDWVHDEVRKLLSNIRGFVLYAVERRLTLDLGKGNAIVGHCDGVIGSGDRVIAFDIKTMSSYAYRKAEKGELNDSYLQQAACYVSALQDDGYDITEFWFICVDREKMVFHIHEVDFFTEEGQDDLKVRRETVEENYGIYRKCVEDGRIPHPIPPERKKSKKGDYTDYLNWECCYCQYRDKCWLYDQDMVLKEAGRKNVVIVKEKE